MFIVKTGLGYYKDKDGNAVCYVRLPAGEHPDPNGGVVYVEVDDEKQLPSLYVPELTIFEKKKIIQGQLRDIDMLSLRSLRAVITSSQEDINQTDIDTLKKYENQAKILREQLNNLGE